MHISQVMIQVSSPKGLQYKYVSRQVSTHGLLLSWVLNTYLPNIGCSVETLDPCFRH